MEATFAPKKLRGALAALSGALLAIRSRTAYIAFLMGLCVISALIVFRSNSFFSV